MQLIFMVACTRLGRQCVTRCCRFRTSGCSAVNCSQATQLVAGGAHCILVGAVKAQVVDSKLHACNTKYETRVSRNPNLKNCAPPSQLCAVRCVTHICCGFGTLNHLLSRKQATA